MKLKTPLKLLLVILLLNSCQKDEFDSAISQIKPEQSQLSVSSDSSSVSFAQAKNIAAVFLKKNPSTRSTSSERSIKSVSEIKNTDDTPAMYVINYNDDKGFVIISATKNYYPILAFSDKGHFDTSNIPRGIDLWVSQSTSIIENQKSDSAVNINKYRLEWIKYEKSERPVLTKGDTDLAALVRSYMDEWDSQGLIYKDLMSGCPDGMSNEMFQQFCDVAAGLANPDYNYLSNSFIVIKQDCQNTEFGPFLETEWSQENGFNTMLTPIDGQYPPAGCIAVAMAQVMRYYKWPQRYNWNAMSNYYATVETRNLLKDIGTATDMNYSLEASSSNLDKASNAFVNTFGYSSTIHKYDHNGGKVYNELKNSRPVIMGGFRTQVLDLGFVSWVKHGHAWVCDGYLSSNTTTTYSLYVLTPYEPLQYEFTGYSYTGASGWEAYHMNWGWNGIGNGYYDNNDIAISLIDKNGNTVIRNYQYRREDLINIIPNK